MPIDFLVDKFQLFLLILMRLFGMFVVAPFFSSVMIPMRIKAILAVGITIIVFPIISEQIELNIPGDFIGFVLLITNQVAIGLIIGLFVAIVFGTFQLAGQFFSIQMGFGISEVFDPLSQIHVPLVGQFLALLGTMIFLYIGGHIVMIEAIVESFQHFPVVDLLQSSKKISDSMLLSFTTMFEVALKLALPIIGTLFVVTLSMGLLAKFAPQMNILMLGFPIYITIGFIMLVLLMPFILENGRWLLEQYLAKSLDIF